MKFKLIILLIIILFTSAGCALTGNNPPLSSAVSSEAINENNAVEEPSPAATENDNADSANKDVLDEKQYIIEVVGTKDGVEDFIRLMKERSGTVLNPKEYLWLDSLTEDNIYNITSPRVTDRVDCRIFKLRDTFETFVVFGDKVYPIGISFGGFGSVDILSADPDGDGTYELICTYSYGSGLHRSHVGIMNLEDGTFITADYTLFNKDMLLAETEEGTLMLYEAAISGFEEGMNYTLTSQTYIGALEYKDGILSLK